MIPGFLMRIRIWPQSFTQAHTSAVCSPEHLRFHHGQIPDMPLLQFFFRIFSGFKQSAVPQTDHGTIHKFNDRKVAFSADNISLPHFPMIFDHVNGLPIPMQWIHAVHPPVYSGGFRRDANSASADTPVCFLSTGEYNSINNGFKWSDKPYFSIIYGFSIDF